MNIDVQVLESLFLILLGINQEVGLLGHLVILCDFLRNCRSLFHSGTTLCTLWLTLPFHGLPHGMTSFSVDHGAVSVLASHPLCGKP